MEVRIEPFSIVSAIAAVGALLVSVYLGLAHDRPSLVPAREPGGEHVSIGCDELPGWIERTRAQGYTSLVRVRAGLGYRRASDALPELRCPSRSYRMDFPDRPDTSRRGVLVRITPDGRLVAPLRSGDPSPRADAVAAHRVGLALGVLAVLLGLLAWARRPFDPLRDHCGSRAPARSTQLEARSNDRVLVGERELSHRTLAMRDGSLAEGAGEHGAHIGLPGAEQGYRDAAGGEPFVHGPPA